MRANNTGSLCKPNRKLLRMTYWNENQYINFREKQAGIC